MSAPSPIDALLKQVVGDADQKKALDIRVYKPKSTVITDFIVVMSVQNPIHAKSLLRELDRTVSDFLKETPSDDFYAHVKQSGTPESGWLILDANAIMVHIISEAIRAEYQLDSLFEKRAVIFHL